MGTHISLTLDLPGYLELVKHLYKGSTLSNCPMPCKTFRTNAKMTSKRPAKQFVRVLLSFSEKVTIIISLTILSDINDNHRA